MNNTGKNTSMDNIENFFDLEKQAREKIRKGEDRGHTRLLDDLRLAWSEAESFKYHDFLNEEYPMPKHALVLRLKSIIDKAQNGVYDN